MVRTILSSILIVASLWGVANSADAQRRRRRAQADTTAQAPDIGDLETIVGQLQSADQDQVREAIDMLAAMDREEVVAPLAELLRAGQSDAITDRALQALRVVAEPASIEVLTEFTNHRRVSARRKAYQALAEIEDARVAAIIERGLRDSDRSVRGAAALALGSIGANGSLEVLFRAFERGVVEAATAIGKLGDASALERYNGYLNQQPLGVMLSGYDHFLRRDDIELDVKTQIVERLGEVATPMARRFLEDYHRTFPERIRNRQLREHAALVLTTLRRIRETPAGGAAQ